MTVERPTAFVSTGELPPPERVRTLMDAAHERFASIDDGRPPASAALVWTTPKDGSIASSLRHRRVLGVAEAGGGEVSRMDPRVGDRDAPRGADRVARADRPAVLDERDRRSGVVRDGFVERPELLLGREVTVLRLDARRAEADQRADDGAGAFRLAGGVVGMVQAPDDAVRALVNDQQVDDADDVALAQALELGRAPRR